ncbi:TlpA family protein disulfide reductase [Aequorivita capsosiphonis]|uniref:TlpA family protein disulfide reductase n=1 Tax=Aequorivita capsosiphonis TaxID=487317 RepID=UPI000403EB92|nr:TlpA disulfide reductase family protein [Aequorivita capsosiphonis]
MFNKAFLLFLIIPFFLFCQDSKTENALIGKFSPAKDYDFGILYRLTPTGKVYAKDSKVGENGEFKINLDSLPKGSYRLVYNLPEEVNYFDLIFNGKDEVSFTFSEESGVVFSDAQNKMLSEYLNKMTSVENELNSELTADKPNANETERLLRSQLGIQNKAEKESENSFASLFIKANKPYIPNDFKNRNIYFGDKKSNFFKNFDFEDRQLQSSSFPIKIIEKYYYEFIEVQGASFYRSIINDISFELRNCDSEFQKTLLAEFWQSLVNRNKNNAANYLAENYLSDLASSLDDTALSEKLNLFKNLAIGAKAPDFSWKDENDNKNTFYTTDVADYYVLVFWSSECSHCMEQMPVLNEKMTNLKSEKIKVIAIGLEMEDEPWKETITKLPSFIHVFKTDEDRANITLKYNITGTPTYYVLDKNKKIIGKPRGQKNLFGIIDSLEAYKK